MNKSNTINMASKLTRLSLIFATVLLLFAGCRKDKDKGYDEDMLVGTWKCSDGFSYRFNESGSGRCFDSDDNGSNLSWNLSDDELTIKYELQGKISKPSTEIFIIEKLTSSKMEAHLVGDDYTYTFTK